MAFPSEPFEEGLVDRIRVLSVGPSDSSYGTVTENETVVSTSDLKARFSVVEEQQKREVPGRGSKRQWKVMVEDTALFEDQTKLYRITGGQGVTVPTDSGPGKFSVLKSQRQRNDIGEFHHVTLIVERV